MISQRLARGVGTRACMGRAGATMEEHVELATMLTCVLSILDVVLCIVYC